MSESASRAASVDCPPSESELPAHGTIYVELRISEALVRRGLQSIISAAQHFTEVGSYAEPHNAATSPIQGTNQPSVVRVIEATALNSPYSKKSCVLLAPDMDSDSIRLAIRQGVRAIVAKSQADRDILPAIQAVAVDRGFLSSALVRDALDWLADRLPAQPGKFPEAYQRLSPREREVLMLLAQAAPNAEIARVMNISVATVRSHIYHMATKLAFRSREEAVIFGYEWRSLRNSLFARLAARPLEQHNLARLRIL